MASFVTSLPVASTPSHRYATSTTALSRARRTVPRRNAAHITTTTPTQALNSSINPSTDPTTTTAPSAASASSPATPQQQQQQQQRVKFPALRADAFRHPIDIRATRLLQSFIGLEAAIRALLRVAEQTFFFENIATGVKVSDKQYPSINALLLEACDVLDIAPPQLYIRQNATPNAYTLAVQGDKPFIVVHSSLVDLLTPAELQAVLAHELGHLKSEHGIWVTMANLLVLLTTATLGGPSGGGGGGGAAGPVGASLGRAISDMLSAQLLAWQRSAELTCDRAMLLVLQDTRVAMSALMKLSGGVSKYADEMDVDEFVKQADVFDRESSSNWVGRRMRESMLAAQTHPLPIMRVRELSKWAESNHFRSLIRSGKPLRQRQLVEDGGKQDEQVDQQEAQQQ